jgi:hypothetical protein
MPSSSDSLKFSILCTLKALSNSTEKVIEPGYLAAEYRKRKQRAFFRMCIPPNIYKLM